MKKALLVTPSANLIETIEIGDHYTEISKAIDCQYFTIACHIGNNDVYCDDEGLIRNLPAIFLTKIEAYPEQLAGKLLILGSTPDGDSCDVTMTPEEFRETQKPEFFMAISKDAV